MNIEHLKMKAKEWFRRGIGHVRTSEEVQAYLEGLEDAILISYESMGRSSTAVYEANTAFSELDDYFQELLGDE